MALHKSVQRITSTIEVVSDFIWREMNYKGKRKTARTPEFLVGLSRRTFRSKFTIFDFTFEEYLEVNLVILI